MVKTYVFLRGLLLLAGDVERNPGPYIQGRLRAGSCQLDMPEHIVFMLLVIVVVESGYDDTILVDCSMQVLVVTDRCTYTFLYYRHLVIASFTTVYSR